MNWLIGCERTAFIVNTAVVIVVGGTVIAGGSAAVVGTVVVASCGGLTGWPSRSSVNPVHDDLRRDVSCLSRPGRRRRHAFDCSMLGAKPKSSS